MKAKVALFHCKYWRMRVDTMVLHWMVIGVIMLNNSRVSVTVVSEWAGTVWILEVVLPLSRGDRRSIFYECGSWRVWWLWVFLCSCCRRLCVWNLRDWTVFDSSLRPSAWALCRWMVWRGWWTDSWRLWSVGVRFYRRGLVLRRWNIFLAEWLRVYIFDDHDEEG